MPNTSTLPGKYASLYSEALGFALPHLSDTQLEILRALMTAPQRTASAGEIAKQLGLHHHINVSAALADMGTFVLEFMNLNPLEAAKLFPKPWRILAIEGQPGLVNGFPWQLRPEVIDGLTHLGFPDQSRYDSDERIAANHLTEEASKLSWVETRRRNAIARTQCLAVHKSACGVCGMDFGLAYGAEFCGCIHVHHLFPMAAASGTRTVDPSTDLVPVCPNCHAAIHAHGEIRSIAEVKTLMQLASVSDR